MSIEGVLDNKKHGGAHVLTHEIVTNHDTQDLYVLISDNSFPKQTIAESDCAKFQDGCHKENDSDENVFIPDNLQFLPDDLDKYEQAVVENNTEWLKARCRAMDTADFDMVSQGSANMELLGIMDDGVIPPSSDAISELPLSVNPNNAVLISDNQKSLVQTTNLNVTPSHSCISSVSGEGQIPVSIETDLSSYTNADMQLDGILLSADKDKDLELESLNPVSINNDLKESPIGDIQCGFSDHPLLSDLNSGRSNIRVVMKDGVLSVVPNETEFAANSLVEQDGIENAIPKISNSFIHEDPVNSCPSVLTVQPLLQSQDTIAMNTSDGSVANSQLNLSSINRTENLALATISISNDKHANSTKILVDTNQGRQLYQLNMSDLTGLLNNPVNRTGTEPENSDMSTNIISPVKQDQLAGAQSVSGYLLLSVTNKDSDVNQSFLTTSPKNSQVQTSGHQTQKQKNEPMYMCTYEGCGKLFRALSKLTVHNMTHTGERPFKCSEPGCDWAFTKAYKLKRHEESHKGSKNHVCKLCNKRFTTIYNLKSHLKGHSRPCTEECPVESCGLKFQTRRELDKHLKTHEGVEKTYKCPFEGCNKLFLSPHCLGSHPRVHLADPMDLTCQFEGCGRKFDKLCRLKQHQRVHTGERPYACHFEGCNWAFSSASKLTRHMTKHTNKRKWVCKECGKAFMRAEHLKGHMITHSGIKPFECPVPGCGQKFVAKSSVYVHMKKHDNLDKDITYHCPMEACDKKYSNKAKLRQHIVKHFPGTLKPEDAAQLDIVPLFKNEEEKMKETVVQTSAVTVKTEADGTMKIDPVEFIATTVDKDGGITTSVSNQFTAELTAELSSICATTDTSKLDQQSPHNSFHKSPSPRKDGNEGSGSARTDYYSNKLLSDRAKKRRRLLKEKAEGSVSSEDPLDQTNSALEDTSQLTGSDAMCSQGITFRDPATGVLYVQMQLLQDDPPHPELYSDEAILTSDMQLPDSADSDIQCHNVQPAEFVGSTINLQDLV